MFTLFAFSHHCSIFFGVTHCAATSSSQTAEEMDGLANEVRRTAEESGLRFRTKSATPDWVMFESRFGDFAYWEEAGFVFRPIDREDERKALGPLTGGLESSIRLFQWRIAELARQHRNELGRLHAVLHRKIEHATSVHKQECARIERLIVTTRENVAKSRSALDQLQRDIQNPEITCFRRSMLKDDIAKAARRLEHYESELKKQEERQAAEVEVSLHALNRVRHDVRISYKSHARALEKYAVARRILRKKILFYRSQAVAFQGFAGACQDHFLPVGQETQARLLMAATL